MRTQLFFAGLGVIAAGCSAPMGHDAGPDVVDDFVEAATDVPQDGPIPIYDAGPVPACSVTAFARHIIDRPGGEQAQPPTGLVRTANGFLVGYHHGEGGPGDGGVDAGGADGGVFVDRIEALAIADDGTAGTPHLVYDGPANGQRLLGPVFLPSGAGALAVFDTTAGDPRDPSYDVQLRASFVDVNAMAMAPTTLRSRYDLPQMVSLTTGDLISLGLAFGDSMDGGVVAARPVSMFLHADGSNARPMDLDLVTRIPSAITNPVLRSGDDGAYYLYREGQRLGFVRFGNDGALAGRQVYSVTDAIIRRIEGSGVRADGIVVAWGEDMSPHTSVKAIVVGTDGGVRGMFELDAFDGEGPTVASAVPAYGGVAVMWRRGTGAAARLRVAIVGPDGRLKVPAQDLIATPNLEDGVVAWASGREVAFVGRDGTGSAWGYLFGRACLPAM